MMSGVATPQMLSFEALSTIATPFSPGIVHPPQSPLEDSTASYADRVVRSLKSFYDKMTTSNMTCREDCSGRGECMNGTCFCVVQYEGESCHEPNTAYFASFSSIFICIAAISLAQLFICIRAEYHRMKNPSLKQACSVTTQKLLYFISFVAAAVRGAYYYSPSNSELSLAPSFFSSFYPVILSGGSLIVCFWAEAFHLRDVDNENPRFLGKSFIGFAIFNVITYSLFVGELVLQGTILPPEDKELLTVIFNGCYAVLLFITVVFFLIYGVEVYFKIRGGFVMDSLIVVGGNIISRPRDPDLPHAILGGDQLPPEPPAGCPASSDESQELIMKKRLTTGSRSNSDASVSCDGTNVGNSSSRVDDCGEIQDADDVVNSSLLIPPELDADSSASFDERKQIRIGALRTRGIDQSQLSQSRFGLVFQAVMLLVTVCFLATDVMGALWKTRVPVMSRNAFDIVFRVVELAVMLWFPCVLWNCIAPEQLWILNPSKILKKIDIEKHHYLAQPSSSDDKEASQDPASAGSSLRECWICYETSEDEATGPLIEPCLCRGDMAVVHHNCLRTWLQEREQGNKPLECQVCRASYQLERSGSWSWLIPSPHGSRQWVGTAVIVTVMCGSVGIAFTMLRVYPQPLVQSVTVGATLIVNYVCFRFLGFNTYSAYQKARYSAVKILSKHFQSVPQPDAPSDDGHSLPSSSTFSLDSASTASSRASRDSISSGSSELSTADLQQAAVVVNVEASQY